MSTYDTPFNVCIFFLFAFLASSYFFLPCWNLYRSSLTFSAWYFLRSSWCVCLFASVCVCVCFRSGFRYDLHELCIFACFKPLTTLVRSLTVLLSIHLSIVFKLTIFMLPYLDTHTHTLNYSTVSFSLYFSLLSPHNTLPPLASRIFLIVFLCGL